MYIFNPKKKQAKGIDVRTLTTLEETPEADDRECDICDFNLNNVHIHTYIYDYLQLDAYAYTYI